jgi:hypothetical protein
MKYSGPSIELQLKKYSRRQRKPRGSYDIKVKLKP